MFISITAKATSAVAAAALVASLAVILTTVAPDANAQSQLRVTRHPHHAKVDRLPLAAKGPACSLRGWPNYEPSCEFDMRRPANEKRTVRVIALR